MRRFEARMALTRPNAAFLIGCSAEGWARVWPEGGRRPCPARRGHRAAEGSVGTALAAECLSGEAHASAKHDGGLMPRQHSHEGTDGRATAPGATQQPTEERFRVGLARAFAGAIIFALPLLMTMEMWWLGFYMVRHRLVEPAQLNRIISEQGFEMNRPSILHIEVANDPQTLDVVGVRVGGGVVVSGRGEIILS